MKLKIIFFVLCCSSLMLQSCNTIKGNGNVTLDERPVAEFTNIHVSAGVEVYLIPGTTNKVVVETDENLQKTIKTNVKNGILRISREGNVLFASEKNVYVTYVNLNQVVASSGAEIKSDDVLKSQELILKASSGAEIDLEILSETARMQASSGSEIEVQGKAINLYLKTSSGATIDAEDLLAKNVEAQASSGGKIDLSAEDKLNTKASSGGSISYKGTPSLINNKETKSGNVRKK